MLRPWELLLHDIHSGDDLCSTNHRKPNGRKAVDRRDRVSVVRGS